MKEIERKKISDICVVQAGMENVPWILYYDCKNKPNKHE